MILAWVILLGEARGSVLYMYPGTLTGAAPYGEDRTVAKNEFGIACSRTY